MGNGMGDDMGGGKRVPNDAATNPPRPFAPFKAPSADYPTFLPVQPTTIGAALPAADHPQNSNLPQLFEPIKIRGVEWPNRMWVAPMCMYSSDNGHATDHHFIHHGSMAMRGWGNLMVEATAVVPEGRISPEDSGLWEDAQIAGFKRIVDYVHALGGKIGIQLAHAGRKASTLTPWIYGTEVAKGYKGGEVVLPENGGWPETVTGPSAVSFHEGYFPEPVAASLEYIESIKAAYVAAVERSKKAGFDYVEIHGAHGYFMHEFLSPISNQRTDQYGGSFENRIRLALEITKAVRAAWDGPLLFRVSATDWLDEVLGEEKQGGEWKWWGKEQTALLAKELHALGVDLLDVSTGGNDLRGKIKVGPDYQVPYARYVKDRVPGLLIGAVGLITDPQQAENILQRGDADVVLFGREVLRHVDFPLAAAEALGVAAAPAVQYSAAWSRMLRAPKIAIPPA
ncbi:hypothetical protein Q8F55_009048 [Vanrija albida]|uniref:NADH:flavin oxidoreductase/NADH oxidase N-terminal domain-containing protein n=1 Tax=Vanrija albida TaxID=181172 RepID=A0ABR3PSJ4_9TREE